MSKDNDTIAAISTPLGEGGIGIIRISGSSAFSIADKVFRDPLGKYHRRLKPWGVRYGSVIDPKTKELIDEVLAIAMPSPNSFTREDVVEFSCHGGAAVLTRVLEVIIDSGARLAEAGEFTKRAFLSGRIDLSQAEAIIDVIRAKTDSARRLASANLKGRLSDKINWIRDRTLLILAHIEAEIDFPDDDIGAFETKDIISLAQEVISELKSLIHTGINSRVYRDGVSVVLLGKPNVGKSSLFNTMVGKMRAIVTDIPGTTRDIIDDWVTIKGVPVRLIDTAGMRKTQDLIEKLGVKAASQQAKETDLVLAIVDASQPVNDDDIDMISKVADKPGIIVVNKCDLENKIEENNLIPYKGNKKILWVSAKTGEGIDKLEKALAELAIHEITGVSENPIMINTRQLEALQNTVHSMEEAIKSLKSNVPHDLIVVDIYEASFWLDQITGRSVSDDLTEKIFSEFCIGK